MFSILNELKDDSPSSVVGVVGSSIGGAASMYLLVAITGYLTFGNDVNGNIVSMSPMNDMRFAILTTLILICGYLVALSVTSLERVLAYVGSIGSTSISFILPGLFYYKISDPESMHHQKLLKEDDDAGDTHDDSDIEDSAAMVTSIQSLGSAASVAIDPRKWRKKWRWDLEHIEHDLLRKMALALSIYGMCVMTVCLIMNIVFHASH
ncbi:hypothetical protein ACHAQA_006962 [Verticillium albo-atrum]